MPGTYPPYAPEYRRRIIELARAERSVQELARELEPSANAIRNWVKQTALDEGLRSDGLTSTEREELSRLRRENRAPPARIRPSIRSHGCRYRAIRCLSSTCPIDCRTNIRRIPNSPLVRRRQGGSSDEPW
jgi:transposase